MYGYDSAFIGGTLNLPSFQARFGLDVASDAEKANLSSNIVSTFQGGAFFGSALGCLIAERFGRKPLLIFAAVIFTLGAGLQLAGTLSCLYAGRVFTGWGVGATAMVNKLRGSMFCCVLTEMDISCSTSSTASPPVSGFAAGMLR